MQEAWLRLSRSDSEEVENLGGWLTTVVARICLNTLRARRSRREAPMTPHVPEPIVSPASGIDPEHEALLADSVGLALLVVLESWRPPSGSRSCCTTCSPCRSTRSRRWSTARRRPRASSRAAPAAGCRAGAAPDADLDRQREVVDAFFAAARDGDFEALVAVLDPDVVLRADGGAAARARRASSAARASVARRGAAAPRSSARTCGPRW